MVSHAVPRHPATPPVAALRDHSVCPLFFLRVWLSFRGLQDGYLFPFYERCQQGRNGEVSGYVMQYVCERQWPYANFRDLLKDQLWRLGCGNAKFIGTHSLRRGGTQLLLLLGVPLPSVRQRGFWTTYHRMETYLASNNRQELEGDLLPAPTLLAYSSFMSATMDHITASLSK